MPQKLAKTEASRAGALRTHVALLREYAQRAFVANENAFLGEIAGKLRVLVCETKKNPALLLRLMDDLKIDERIVLGGPPLRRMDHRPVAGDTVTLRQFMDLDAFGTRQEEGNFVMLTKKQFILCWAQQCGAAHEALEVDEPLARALDSGIWIGGVPAATAELRATTEAVLHVVRRVLDRIETANGEA